MKTYICHYPKLKERIDYLIPSLNKKGIYDIEIIYGIDRSDVNDSHFHIFSNDTNLIKDRMKYTNCPIDYNIFDEKQKPIIANFLTHMNIWEKICKSQEEYSLILEDDAIICDDFLNNWNKLILDFPKNLDIGYLHEGCGFTVQNRLFVEINQNKIWYDCWIKESRTCCSYIISKNFCNKILSNLEPITLPVDHELNYIQKKLNANVYWTFPALFEEGSVHTYKSSIR